MMAKCSRGCISSQYTIQQFTIQKKAYSHAYFIER